MAAKLKTILDLNQARKIFNRLNLFKLLLQSIARIKNDPDFLSLRGSANLSTSEFNIEASAIARNRKQRQDTQARSSGTRNDPRMIVSDDRNNARDTLDRTRASGGSIALYPSYLPTRAPQPGMASCIGYLLNCIRLRPRYERPTTVTALRKRCVISAQMREE